MKTKKITMGVLATAVAITPVIAVSCGKQDKEKTNFEKFMESKKTLESKIDKSLKLNETTNISTNLEKEAEIKKSVIKIFMMEPLFARNKFLNKSITKHDASLSKTFAYDEWTEKIMKANNANTSAKKWWRFLKLMLKK
ncbi:hypothetical protein [Mycoplasma todarodis]|uniref:hypothetical protein n=1 Tax=Mycoplasma todarodis TaxID=1937191 RepID=UPI003B33A03C